MTTPDNRPPLVRLLDDLADMMGNCTFISPENGHRCGPLPEGHDGPHMILCSNSDHPSRVRLEDGTEIVYLTEVRPSDDAEEAEADA